MRTLLETAKGDSTIERATSERQIAGHRIRGPRTHDLHSLRCDAVPSGQSHRQRDRTFTSEPQVGIPAAEVISIPRDAKSPRWVAAQDLRDCGECSERFDAQRGLLGLEINVVSSRRRAALQLPLELGDRVASGGVDLHQPAPATTHVAVNEQWVGRIIKPKKARLEVD